MKYVHQRPTEFAAPGSRFHLYEISRLWVLYGVPLKSFRDFMESVMVNMQSSDGSPYIYDDQQVDTEWTAFI
jgi:hypothetical protein